MYQKEKIVPDQNFEWCDKHEKAFSNQRTNIKTCWFRRYESSMQANLSKGRINSSTTNVSYKYAYPKCAWHQHNPVGYFTLQATRIPQRDCPNRSTQGRNKGGRGAQFPGRRISMGSPNNCGERWMTAWGAEQSQQYHKSFPEYSAFAS